MSSQPTDTELGNIQAAILAGEDNANIEGRIGHLTFGPGGSEVPIALSPRGTEIAVLKDAMRVSLSQADAPPRRKGCAVLQELASFILHVNRFKTVDSTVWADIDSAKLTAVYNYHSATAPAWGDHGAIYACPLSRAWRLWVGGNGRVMSQDDFADFVEANVADLAGPDPADPLDSAPYPARLIEVARNLKVHSKSVFERNYNATTGEYLLTAKLENESQSTKIPSGFFIGIPVFEAGAKYRIEARLRFQLKDGRPSFSYVLVQPEATMAHAFGEIRDQVTAGTGLEVWAGIPEATGIIAI